MLVLAGVTYSPENMEINTTLLNTAQLQIKPMIFKIVSL